MRRGKSFELGNRGFSLVELIIVVAIMAILVGVVGTQVIPYLNNAKKAKDIQILGGFATAAVAAYASHADAEPASGTMSVVITSGGTEDTYTCSESGSQVIADEMKHLMGNDYVTDADDIFESKEYVKIRKITVNYDFNNRKVTVVPNDGTDDIGDTDSVTARL